MSITAANAVIMLNIPAIFPVPVQLQQFSTDDVFDTDPIVAAETAMGVDGFLSGGFVFAPTPQGYTLQADSPSNSFFDGWFEAMQTARDAYNAGGIIVLPGLGRKWSMVKGFLSSYSPVPSGKKILQPRKHIITWERASPSAA